MSSLGGSVEDFIVKKLKLNEQLKKEQAISLLNYFKQIIAGEVKTSPPELKGLLGLMYKKLKDDEHAEITKYLLEHDKDILYFFNDNFQRFNYFEFKHQLMLLKGEFPKEEFRVPLYEERNFEVIEPLDITPYEQILESNKIDIKVKREKVENKNARSLAEEKQKRREEFNLKFDRLRKTVKENLAKGALSQEELLAQVKKVAEVCVPAVYLLYNIDAVESIGRALIDQEQAEPDKLFDKLNMSNVSRELFCRLLIKKTKTLKEEVI